MGFRQLASARRRYIYAARSSRGGFNPNKAISRDIDDQVVMCACSLVFLASIYAIARDIRSNDDDDIISPVTYSRRRELKDGDKGV